MGNHARWPRVLTFVGGAGLVGSFFLTAVDNWLFDFSPMILVARLSHEAFSRGSVADKLHNLAGAFVISLPHLFGLHVALDLALPKLMPTGGNRLSRSLLRSLLLLWLLSSGLLLLSMPDRKWDVYARSLCFSGFGLIFLGHVILPRWKPSGSPGETLRRGWILGALVCLLWFGFLLAHVGDPVVPAFAGSITASTLILVGSLFGRRTVRFSAGE